MNTLSEDEGVRDALAELQTLHGEDKVSAAICSLGFDTKQLLRKVEQVVVMTQPLPLIPSKDPNIFINPDMNAIATEVENERKQVQLGMIRDRLRTISNADVSRWLAASRKVEDSAFSFTSLPPTPWQVSQSRKAEKTRQDFLAETAQESDDFLRHLIQTKKASDLREAKTNESRQAYLDYVKDRDAIWAQRAQELRERQEKIKAAAEASAAADRKRRAAAWQDTAAKLEESRKRRALHLQEIAGVGTENKNIKLQEIYEAAVKLRLEKAAEMNAKQADRAAAQRAADEAAAEQRRRNQIETDEKIRRKNERVREQQAQTQKSKEAKFLKNHQKFEKNRYQGNALLSARSASVRANLETHFSKNQSILSHLSDNRDERIKKFKTEYRRHTQLAATVKGMGVKNGIALATHFAERKLWEGAAAENARRLAKAEETKKAYLLLRIATTQRKIDQVRDEREEFLRLKQNTGRIQNVKKDELKATFEYIKAETNKTKIAQALGRAGVHEDFEPTSH